ncbi:uncharacterized protein LOC127089247 [Lathyrus oleraceus]|uniref:uncharacterized protein LOC127089247 n=1 Tax=Pisum sativum TaxID=3888 RepID=UPI0021D182FB|nr:uncharacterized protein LOC127089247 [Pisum sativum]
MAPPKSSSSKHSKKTQDSTLHPVHELNGPMTVGNQQYVPEPPNEREKECIYKSQVLIPVLVSVVKIPTKKTSVEASPGAAKKPSTKVSRKPPPVQKRKKEEEKEEERVLIEESGDESPEPNPPPPQKKKIKRVSSQRSIVKSAKKDSSSTPTAKLQSKDTESGKSSFNTEIPEKQLAVVGKPTDKNKPKPDSGSALKTVSSMPTFPKDSTKGSTMEMAQTKINPEPEKTLEETVQEEDIPKNDHDTQTVAEFDTTMSEASEDDSPPHPGLNATNKGDDTDMETEVEDDHEEETAKDEDE